MVTFFRTIFKMRKYHQLLLFIITVISVSTLFVYRREYLKLRYVLEVLNYFGTPQGGVDECLVLNQTFMDKERTEQLFSQPQPIWIKVGQHFIYSSFWENEEGKLHARVLALGPPSAFSNFECHVWFDNGDYLSSAMGRFGYTLRNIPKYYNDTIEQQEINFYELFCEPVEPITLWQPYGVLLLYKKYTTQIKTFIPLYKSVFVDRKKLDKVVVCVKADITGASKSSILEFLSYHQAVGVTNFIFYDNGLQYKILSVLKSVLDTENGSQLSVLNWNFPYNDLDAETAVLETDCIARTGGMVQLVAILNLDEYLIPKVQYTIKEMIQKESPSPRIPVQFEIESFICCTDLKNDKRADKSWPLALRKTQIMSLKVRKQIIIQYPLGHVEPSTHKLPLSSGVIHIYRQCSGLKTITKYDPIMARFLGNFMTSKLLRLWQSGSLLQEIQKL